MNNKITRSQFKHSLDVQSDVLMAQSYIQKLQHHLEFLTRSAFHDELSKFTTRLEAFSSTVLYDFSQTLSDDEK